MLNQINKLKESSKIEFWAVAIFHILVVLVTISSRMVESPSHTIPGNLQRGDLFISTLFQASLSFILYLLLLFHVSPELKKTEKAPDSVFVVFFLILVCGLLQVFGPYLIAILGIKLLLIYFDCFNKVYKKSLVSETTLLLSVWLLLVSLTTSLSSLNITLYQYYVLPAAGIAYLLNIYKFLPGITNKRYRIFRYFFKVLLAAIISTLLILSILIVFYPDYSTSLPLTIIERFPFNSSGLTKFRILGVSDDMKGFIALGNFLTQMVFIAPISSAIYKKRHQKQQEEIISLKSALGKSDASLSLLKSQINPHFLFNALNTLYGTALQENAERTGEGIQKLGDMMRFMLHENVHDKISLHRDLEYLKNYILLQKLRTSVSDSISIQDVIEAPEADLLITPMLLIPFVENAFKHGISLNNPSHIKVNLYTKEHTLYFDVYNSIHKKPGQDHEKGESGIGLGNVKQRLQLLYPHKHELIIRESPTEFFIHLTIDLEEAGL